MAVLAVAGIAAVAAGGAAAAAGVAAAGILTAASIGFSVGSLLGQMLFPTKTHTDGARLGDLTISSSAFGSVRPIVYGRARIAGNVIWAKPLREQKTDKKAGKGGMGGGASSSEYSYFATFALAMCDGPIDHVTRIWADTKLVYDASSGSDTIKKTGFKFRFYPGSETQLPDSLIEADKGVGNVPGYRGTCYLVFDDIPLADYGNRIPNIQCELTTVADVAYLYDQWVPLTPSMFHGLGMANIGVDPDRMLAYVLGTDPVGLIVVDLATMQVVREKAMGDILTDGTDGLLDPFWFGFNNANLLIGPDGALYFKTGQDSSAVTPPTRLVRVDPNTLTETASFPATGGNTTSSFSSPRYLCTLSYWDPLTAARIELLVVVGFFGAWGCLFMPSMTYGSGAGQMLPNSSRGVPPIPTAIVQGKVALNTGEAWVLSCDGIISGSNVYIDCIGIGRDIMAPASPANASVERMATFAPEDIDTAAVPGTISFWSDESGLGSLNYDAADDTLLFQVATIVTHSFAMSGTFLVKWSPASGIIYVTKMGTDSSGWLAQSSDISAGTFAKFYSGRIMQIDSITGAVQLSQITRGSPGHSWPIDNGTAWAQAYDSVHQIIVALVNDGSSHFLAKVKLGRMQGAGTTLETIVSDQCKRAGLLDADFDASTLTDVVEGFVVSQRTTVADVLTPLIGAYFVDAVETDYVLQFNHRGGGTVASIIEDELIRIDDKTSEPYVETRQQEIELPMRLTVTYTDFDKDYQVNTQAAKRSRNPDPTVFSDNQSDLTLGVISTATPMKQMAEKILFTLWNERHTFQVRLPPKYGYLNPADPVTITLNDGYTARARVATTDIGVDYSLDVTLLGETDGQYTSFAAADAGVAWGPSQVIADTAFAQLFLLDTPLLRDVDDLGGTAIRSYWAGSPFQRGVSWPGGVLQQAGSTLSWEILDATSGEATWGYVETPPADWPAVFATQFDGTLTVNVAGGDFEPSSVTDLDMANGANPLVLLKSDGTVEVIQYRDVTALGSNRYTLSVLRRGQRGTDTMANGHLGGERFVFLDAVALNGLALDLGERNVLENYRLVPNGSVGDTASVLPFVFHGRDMMPYAPVNFARAIVGSDLVVTWHRRSRIGGYLVDGSDTPALHEASEAYEAYTLASAGAYATFDPTNSGTYVRAYTGLSAATLTYTAAQMASDGFTPTTSTLYLVVFQLSATVGRGFPGYQAVAAF